MKAVFGDCAGSTGKTDFANFHHFCVGRNSCLKSGIFRFLIRTCKYYSRTLTCMNMRNDENSDGLLVM